jgi:3-methylcrotonyl-CoA carboxylase alpha subunit
MIAKVIVWDENRSRCIDNMIKTLQDCCVFGVETNIPYLIKILDHEEFRSGVMTTRFIETYFPAGLNPEVPIEQVKTWARQIQRQMQSEAVNEITQSVQQSPWTTYWRGV